MKEIFLSRPNWVDHNYKGGLDNFLNLLKSYDLNPRTVGSTDFPSKSPMDEVIDLLYKCEGAIILGYPQIQVKSGFVKDKEITDSLFLPTEWNHIEAGLAHALGLPLLVIHHINIKRGIFDRGVLNSFLYQKDFTDKSWGISEEIIGSLSQWKNKLRPIKKSKTQVQNEEKPLIKWGCFKFDGDDNLYCPFCYTNEGLKMLTLRVDGKSRQCSSCSKLIPS